MCIRFVLISALACASWLSPSTASARPLSDWLTEELEWLLDSSHREIPAETREMLLAEGARHTEGYSVSDFYPCQLDAILMTMESRGIGLAQSRSSTLDEVRMQFTRALLESLHTEVYEPVSPEIVDAQIEAIAAAVREGVAAMYPELVTNTQLDAIEAEWIRGMQRSAEQCTSPVFKAPLPDEVLAELLETLYAEPLQTHTVQGLERDIRVHAEDPDAIIGTHSSTVTVNGRTEHTQTPIRRRDRPLRGSRNAESTLRMGGYSTISRVLYPRWREVVVGTAAIQAHAAVLHEAYERAGVGDAEAQRIAVESAERVSKQIQAVREGAIPRSRPTLPVLSPISEEVHKREGLTFLLSGPLLVQQAFTEKEEVPAWPE